MLPTAQKEVFSVGSVTGGRYGVRLFSPTERGGVNVEYSSERRLFLKSMRSCRHVRCCTPMTLAIAVAVVLSALAAIPSTVAATDIAGESRTYLSYRETTSGNKLLPLYEYLNFSIHDVGKEDLSFHVGGWLRYDLKDDTRGKDKNSDLQYAFLSYRHKEANMTVNLGRIMVFEGVASERLDGVYARTDLKMGFEAAIYGGEPVMTNEGDDSGTNRIYGGRVAHRKDGLYTIGLSYLKQEKNSSDFREEGGVDLWLKPIERVELTGRSSYNEKTDGWMQHAYNIIAGPFAKLRFNAELSRINYEYFFDGTTTSAFTFSPGGAVDPKEKLDLYGVSAFYPVTENINISVDVKRYGYEVAGNAKSYGAGAAFSSSDDITFGASLRRMDGATDRLSFDMYRIYGTKKYGKVNASVDFMRVKYDTAVNGVSNATSVSLAGGYNLTERLALGADVAYAKNPDFDREVRAFVKLIYRFQASLGKGKGV